MQVEQLTDMTLVQRICRQGCAQASDELLDRYGESLCHWIDLLIDNLPLAQQWTQRILIDLWLNLWRVPDQPLWDWMTTLGRHRLQQFYFFDGSEQAVNRQLQHIAIVEQLIQRCEENLDAIVHDDDERLTIRTTQFLINGLDQHALPAHATMQDMNVWCDDNRQTFLVGLHDWLRGLVHG